MTGKRARSRTGQKLQPGGPSLPAGDVPKGLRHQFLTDDVQADYERMNAAGEVKHDDNRVPGLWASGARLGEGAENGWPVRETLSATKKHVP